MNRTALLAFAAVLALAAVAAPASGQSDPNPDTDRWVDTEQVMRFSAVPGGAPDPGGGPTRAEVDATLRLHQFRFEGQTYSADDFREAYDRNFIGDGAVERLEAEVQSRFSDSLNQTLPLASGAETSPASLTNASLNAGYDGDPYQPPLVVEVSGGGDVDLSGLAGIDASRKEVRVAFELGATFEVPLSFLLDPGENVTAQVHAPEGLTWLPDGGADVDANGTVAWVNGTNWKGSTSQSTEASLDVTDPSERAYTEEEVSLEVTADIEGVDLQPTRIPGGSLGKGTGTVDVRGQLGAVELPESAPGALVDAGVTHVSADDVRLLVAEGVVSKETVRERIDNLTSGFRQETPERVSILFSGGLVEESLEGADEAQDETARPVRLHLTADVTLDLAFRSSPSDGSQAIVLHTLDPTLPLKSVEGFPTSYEVILPEGVDLQDVTVTGGIEPETGTTESGRDYFTADVPAGQDEEASVTVAFTEGTLVNQAPEVLVLLGLLILVPVAVVAGYLWHRRGGGQEPTRVEAPDSDQP